VHLCKERKQKIVKKMRDKIQIYGGKVVTTGSGWNWLKILSRGGLGISCVET
jgi:hypothetical protein